ncbi:MAG TPA: hypothetical protein VKU41_21625 [Polyangiaceae bacterium]|nr:hypothetical protein [Polyangiaceae bacterium]
MISNRVSAALGLMLVISCAVASCSSAPETAGTDAGGASSAASNGAGSGTTLGGQPGSGAGGVGSQGTSGSTSGGPGGGNSSGAGSGTTAGGMGPGGGTGAGDAGGAAADATTPASDAATAGTACTRAGLTSAINAYFAALAAHDPTKAPIAPGAKYTEDGTQMTVGSGEWKTAGAVKFKRSALDTDICESATEAVIPDSSGDIVYGLRLKVVAGQITEIETIPVRSYITINPPGLVASSNDDWETVLPASQQPTRAELQSLMDVYFNNFPNGACNFASDCMRLEDGASIGPCTGSGVGCVDGGASSFHMTARVHILDVQAGISVGFTMFAGADTDFHMFKVRGGMVHGVHATLSAASSSGWN